MRKRWALVLLAAGCASSALAAEPGLTFHASFDKGLVAETAAGEATPNFADKVAIVADGRLGGALGSQGDQVLSWRAPGNVQAQRGTLAFFWRAREPVGEQPFPIFRVGYADHTSWDMTWLRVDWNGHGFDAFVTDTGLARHRVSFTLDPRKIAPDAWTHLAFSWDETTGVVLYVDGKPAARKDEAMALDAGLDQFGPFSRVVSPHQVQSAYQFRRGGDLDELRLYDHALAAPEIAALAAGQVPQAAPARLDDKALTRAWRRRFGWDGDVSGTYLAQPSTRIRKVEFLDAWDLKQRMNGSADGIPETTWPGVYNRSRLPGRHDYFELPDWNTYVEGGRAVTFDLPDEPANRLEVRGPAAGSFTWYPKRSEPSGSPTRPPGGQAEGARSAGRERTLQSLAGVRGGALRFDGVAQEVPLQDVEALQVEPGSEPQGGVKLAYWVRAGVDSAAYPALGDLSAYVKGRYAPGEQTIVAALPLGAPSRAGPGRAASRPIAHILIPQDFRATAAATAPGHFSYGWENLDAGLDGVALDIPALKAQPTDGGLLPLNIRVADPLWPGRDLIDVTVAVKPGEARTVWLDTRDRILPPGKGLMITIAAAGGGFDAAMLEGAQVRLVFKPRDAAKAEHVADRWAQARDNMAFLVEEHTNQTRFTRFERLDLELTDLLQVDPDHKAARQLWAEITPDQPAPAFVQPTPPPGIPLWAFRQTEELKLVHRFADWWIDHRQSDYGDFGGGISDDDDLTQQFPPLALMGVEPEKITASLNRLVAAAYRNGMITDGLGTIATDELHSYEEAINAISEAAYLNYGDPATLERLMATARAYPRIIETNPAGHTHFVSNLYSGTHVTREGIWQWSKPYSNLILHPGLLLADYNGDPGLRKTVLALADSYLAHGNQAADGSWSFPAEIYWPTDEARNNVVNYQGGYTILQPMWAAWRWTGDEKYLRPLQAFVGKGDFSQLSTLNANLLDRLGKREAWRDGVLVAAKAERSGGGETQRDINRFNAWQLTGDKSWLETLYGEDIQLDSQRMSMVTDQHWWSDRVELFSDLLQRSRLGGMALRRNQMVPGHMVSWRFVEPAAAERVAILMPGATPTRFTVLAYNLDPAAIHAAMSGWEVAPGTWRVTQGIDADGDDKADGPVRTWETAFERSTAIDLAFPPGVTSVLTFERIAAGDDPATRPDLGIGPGDVTVKGRTVSVIVHSLGGKTAPVGVVEVLDARGKVLAKAPTPGLEAPLDLKPRTVTVQVNLPAAVVPARIRIGLADGAKEVTLANNQTALN